MRVEDRERVIAIHYYQLNHSAYLRLKVPNVDMAVVQADQDPRFRLMKVDAFDSVGAG